MMNSTGYSLADIAAATGGSNSRCADGMWGDGGWWIILLFLVFGWGGNGFGGWGGNGSNSAGLQGIATRADINEGFALNGIERGITSIQQGLCDTTYALNNSIQNGFSANQMQLCNGFNSVQQGFNTLQAQIAGCCCDTQRAIDGINYNMAKNTCDLQNTINGTTRDILESQNANTRAILDFMTNSKLQDLQAENQSLKFAASQNAQNAFISANQNAQTAELIRRLGADCPQPAYIVQPPTPVNFPVNSCGTFSGYVGCGSCGC